MTGLGWATVAGHGNQSVLRVLELPDSVSIQNLGCYLERTVLDRSRIWWTIVVYPRTQASSAWCVACMAGAPVFFFCSLSRRAGQLRINFGCALFLQVSPVRAKSPLREEKSTYYAGYNVFQGPLGCPKWDQSKLLGNHPPSPLIKRKIRPTHFYLDSNLNTKGVVAGTFPRKNIPISRHQDSHRCQVLLITRALQQLHKMYFNPFNPSQFSSL